MTTSEALHPIPFEATYGDLIGILAEERKTIQILNGRMDAIRELSDTLAQ